MSTKPQPTTVGVGVAEPTEQAHWVDALRVLVGVLPEDGALVFVHSTAVATKVRAVIHRRRGRAVGEATRVVAVPRVEDEEAYAGLDLPVFRDPFVAVHRAYLDALTALGGDVPVRIPAAGRA